MVQTVYEFGWSILLLNDTITYEYGLFTRLFKQWFLMAKLKMIEKQFSKILTLEDYVHKD